MINFENSVDFGNIMCDNNTCKYELEIINNLNMGFLPDLVRLKNKINT